MPSKCPVCDEEAVISDQDGDMVVKVCIECGTIVDDSTLTSDPSWMQTPTNLSLGDLAAKVRSNVLEKDQRTKNEYLAQVRTLARQNQLNSDMERTAINLFSQVYDKNALRQNKIFAKQMTCYACVYTALRQFDFPVTLKDFCIKNRVDHPHVASSFRFLLKTTGIKLPFQSTAYLASGLLHQIGLDRHIVEDAVQLINLCSKVWLETGQHRDLLIYTAGYFAWAASKPENHSVPFAGFCRKYKLPVKTLQCLNNIKSALTELTDQLPWSQGKGKRSYIAANLKDVLKYQRSLINTVKKADKSVPSDITAESSTENLLLPVSSDKKSRVRSHTDRNQSEDEPSHSEPKQRRKTCSGPEVLLPPSFVRFKGRYLGRRKHDCDPAPEEEWDGENLTESQDAALDIYIRKPQEIKEIQEIEKDKTSHAAESTVTDSSSDT